MKKREVKQKAIFDVLAACEAAENSGILTVMLKVEDLERFVADHERRLKVLEKRLRSL